ncbi:type II toxin-antitoxin system death-on-curing family toxin [Cryobacterium levicorallinum]|uniref:Death on curing protein n=1 Tax=Cryobacterium levicorallinum TaxID=995038 RepID=A0A1I3DW83_9MICO|nr:type II toxin-antitoxin system death-on-curing family toxin [Cryobacterium levicorallinum]TFB83960.1 type II toxin-antitoxin system death-on-curing family toxin [Cryobacterium levicorallinum]GEP28634.1 toxin Doc [Cryobacterium levicorallinum]SFH90945.1 death on curing protein [Cryobacterium levicorallinum]
MTRYLEVADALQVTERYGFHVRDAGLLASALARPSASMFGTDAYPTFDRKAAALLESLVRNDPLVDGNKRTGWTLMVLFLWINGFAHDFTANEGFDFVIGVAEGIIDLDESERRIAAHRVQRP